MSDDGSKGSEQVPLWKKLWVVAIFILFVVPFLYILIYPSLSHTSAHSALGQVLVYLNSFPIQVLMIGIVIFAWVYLFFLRKRIG